MLLFIPILIVGGVSAAAGVGVWFRYGGQIAIPNSQNNNTLSSLELDSVDALSKSQIISIPPDPSVNPTLPVIRANTNINNLPDELWDHIGTYLNSKDFISFARTDRWFFRYYKINIAHITLMAQGFSTDREDKCCYNLISETDIPGQFLQTQARLPKGFKPQNPNSIPFWNLINITPKWRSTILRNLPQTHPTKSEATKQWLTTLISTDVETSIKIKFALLITASLITIWDVNQFLTLMNEKYPSELISYWNEYEEKWCYIRQYLVPWSVEDERMFTIKICEQILAFFGNPTALFEDALPLLKHTTSALQIAFCLLDTNPLNISANVVRFYARNVVGTYDSNQSRTDVAAFQASKQRISFFNTPTKYSLSINHVDIDRNFAANLA